MRRPGRVLVGIIVAATVIGALTAPATATVVDVQEPRRQALDLEELAGVVLGEIEGKLGRNLSVPWTLKWAEPGLLPPGRTAQTSGATDSSGKLETCVTRLGTPAELLSESELTSLVASGVFTCFQVDLVRYDGLARLPRWVRFGAQAWVGETVSGGTALSTTWWDGWLGQPIVPLESRAYDAIGWFASVEASTGNVWSLLDPLTLDPTMYRTIDHKALEEWATRLARRADLATWESVGPGITATRAVPEEVALAAGAGHQFEVTADTVRLAKLTTEADILDVRINGPIGGGLAGSTASAVPLVLGSTSIAVCLRPDGCVCPDGSSPGSQLVPLTGPSVELAVVAVGEHGKVDVTARKLDDVCPPTTTTTPTTSTTPAAPAAPAANGLVGEWVSTGWEMPVEVFGAVTGGDGIDMVIDADGTIGVDWNGMSPVVAVQDLGGSHVETAITITGTMAGTVADLSGTALSATYESNDVTISVATSVDGTATPPLTMTADEAASQYGLSLPMTSADAAIEGTTLRLSQEIPGGLGTIAIVFERSD